MENQETNQIDPANNSIPSTDQPSTPTQTPVSTKNTNSMLVPLLIIFILILLGSTGFFAYHYFQKQTTYSETDKSAQTVQETPNPTPISENSEVKVYPKNIETINFSNFIYQDDENLYQVKTDSDTPIQLTNFPKNKLVSAAQISPDKSKIAFRVLKSEQLEMLESGSGAQLEWGAPTNIGMIDLPTGDYEEYTAEVFENLQWVNNSKLVYSDASKIYLFDLETKKPTTLVDDIGDRDGPRNSTKVISTNNYIYYSYGIEPHNEGEREVRKINVQDFSETPIISGLNGDDFYPLDNDRVLIQELLNQPNTDTNQGYTEQISILNTNTNSKFLLKIPSKTPDRSSYFYWNRSAWKIPSSENIALKFSDNETNKIVFYSSNGTEIKEVSFENEVNSSHPIQFISDTQFIYYRVIDVEGPYGNGDNRYQKSLVLYDITTKTEVPLIENLQSATISL